MGGKPYGTTGFGGGAGSGTVFSLTTSGEEHVLYSFGAKPDGQQPNDLTQVNGTAYCTTGFGGPAGYGTVFSVTESGGDGNGGAVFSLLP